MKLFLVLNRIFHSFALLTCEISWSTLEVNFIFPHILILFSIYFIVYLDNLYCINTVCNITVVIFFI